MPDSPENKGFGQGDPALARWAEEVFRPEDAMLREIRERSIREGLPAIAVTNFSWDWVYASYAAERPGFTWRSSLVPWAR